MKKIDFGPKEITEEEYSSKKSEDSLELIEREEKEKKFKKRLVLLQEQVEKQSKERWAGLEQEEISMNDDDHFEEFSKQLEKEGRMIISRKNNNSRKKIEFQHIGIPELLLKQDKDGDILFKNEDIDVLNKIFVDRFWNNKIEFLKEKNKKGEAVTKYEKNVKIDVSQMLRTVEFSPPNPEFLGAGGMTIVISFGNLAIGFPKRPVMDLPLKELKNFKKAYILFKSVLEESKKTYGKDTPFSDLYFMYSFDGAEVKLMEKVENTELLQDKIDKQNGDSNQFKFGEILVIMRDLARAIALLEKNEIQHGDIKPNNLLVNVDKGKINNLKIIDYGQLRLRSEQPVYATPNYSPLEFSNSASRSGDVYAVGAIILEIITQRGDSIPDDVKEFRFFLKKKRREGLDEEEEKEEVIKFFETKSKLKNLDPRFLVLLGEMLGVDRPEASDVLKRVEDIMKDQK